MHCTSMVSPQKEEGGQAPQGGQITLARYIFYRSQLSLHLDIRQVCPRIIATHRVSLTAPYLSATPDQWETVIPTLVAGYYMP